MADVPVVLLKVLSPDKEGRARAQIMVGAKAGSAFLQSELPEAVRTRLESLAVGQSLACKSRPDPAPSNIEVLDRPVTPAPAKPGQRPGGREGGFGSPRHGARRADERQDAAPVTGPNQWDDYPFNFAAFAGEHPWPADQPQGASHDAWKSQRVSGVVRVQYQAATPVFVPAGRLTKGESREPQAFCRMVNAIGEERYAIPGSGFKGATRSLFEALTNARLGIVSEDNYDAIPYRRRCATGWVVTGQRPNGDVAVQRVDIEFLRSSGRGWEQRGRNGLEPRPGGAPRVVSTIDEHDPGWQAIEYRANLLWTPNHKHQYTHLGIQLKRDVATVPSAAVARYRQAVEHRTFSEHKDRVADIKPQGPGKNMYRAIATEPLPQRQRELARLDPWVDVVFGFADRSGHLVVFGKNVNFVWPAAKSPRDLIGAFWPLGEDEQTLDTADVAEATFGFAGRHTLTSHPFRARVRPTVLWGPEVVSTPAPAEVQLGPLTSPTGVKLKSRRVYVPPGEDGRAQTYDEARQARGRLMYWPQRAAGNGVATGHRASYVQDAEGASQLPPPISPLPAGTIFEGEVHFDNLTPAELGALLVALNPELFFKKPESTDAFGILIGKGKPRGLGSLHATELSVRVRGTEASGYARLDASPLVADESVVTASVKAYVSWLDAKALALGKPAVRSHRDLPFVRDLAKLLRLPDREVFKNYPKDPGEYGWMPDFGDAEGNPKGGRAARGPAMRLARDI